MFGIFYFSIIFLHMLSIVVPFSIWQPPICYVCWLIDLHPEGIIWRDASYLTHVKVGALLCICWEVFLTRIQKWVFRIKVIYRVANVVMCFAIFFDWNVWHWLMEKVKKLVNIMKCITLIDGNGLEVTEYNCLSNFNANAGIS